MPIESNIDVNTESLVDGYIVNYAEPVATEHHGGYTVQTYVFMTESL